MRAEPPRIASYKEYPPPGVQATSEGGDVTEVTFVDDCQAQPPPDDYETDSEGDFSDREGEDFAPITVSGSGWPIRTHFRLDL